MNWVPLAAFIVAYAVINGVQFIFYNRFLRAIRTERMALHALHDQIEAQLRRIILQ